MIAWTLPMFAAALLALSTSGLGEPRPESFAEALRLEIEDLWGNLAEAGLDRFPARDKTRFFYYYEGIKRRFLPGSRDLEEALEGVRALDARHGSNPHFRWRCDELYALLEWDLGHRGEGIARYRAALDGYPAEAYVEPKEHSAFQHVANELAGRLAEVEGLDAAEAFLLERLREDSRFAYFYSPYWERRLEAADDYERLASLREKVLAIYREKADRDAENREHLLRYAAEIEGERWPLPRRAGGDPRLRYFLLVPPGTAPDDARHLVLVIPGLPGPARLTLPSLTDLHAALGRRYVFAVLSPPGGAPEPGERFLRAVQEDARSARLFSVGKTLLLGWSTSGPAVYAAALGPHGFDGAYVLSSTFDPARLDLASARGRRFYLQHGTQDESAPVAGAQAAAEALRLHGAEVKLDLFEGGHGFAQPDAKYAVRLALSWLVNGD